MIIEEIGNILTVGICLLAIAITLKMATSALVAIVEDQTKG